MNRVRGSDRAYVLARDGNARVEKVCPVCGKTFSIWPSRLHRTNCCSPACAWKARRGRTLIITTDRARKPRLCENCGASYLGAKSRRTCSTACGYALMRRSVIKTCAACGTTFAPKSRLDRAKYCSRACAGVPKRRNQGPGPVGRDGYRGASWLTLAASIRERDSHTCRNCGRRRQEGEKNFPVDHLVPWRYFTEIEEANDPANLATLCPSCHSRKTHAMERRALDGDWTALDHWRRALEVAL